MTATATRPLCKHCRQPLNRAEIEQSADAAMPGAYCFDCTTDAIYGAECPLCNEIPGSRHADPCTGD